MRAAAWPVWLITFTRGACAGNEDGHRPLQPTFRDPGYQRSSPISQLDTVDAV